MEYAVAFYFEENKEEKINSLILKIANSNGNKYMVNNNIPPHITISLFQYNRKIDTIIETMDKNISVFGKGSVTLASMGIFNSNVLFITPIMNKFLLESNKKIVDIIRQNDRIILDENYIGNNWVPHISLAVRLNEEELINGLKTAIKNNTVTDVKINRIAIAECNPYKDIKTWKL
jgi:2'-5' RNA ligase